MLKIYSKKWGHYENVRPEIRKHFHGCYLKRNLFQLTVSKPTGLPESEEINYNHTEILS